MQWTAIMYFIIFMEESILRRYKTRGCALVSFNSPSSHICIFSIKLIPNYQIFPVVNMQLFKFFSLALLPVLTIASPAPEAATSPNNVALVHLYERQENILTGILNDLKETFGAIQELLDAQTLGNIESVVTNLAYFLAEPTTNQTKSVINTASSLLGSPAIGELIGSLPGLLDSVGGLLTPALITNVTDILGGAHDLLTPQFIGQTKGLIADVAPVSATKRN
jgi:hypothetical protein